MRDYLYMENFKMKELADWLAVVDSACHRHLGLRGIPHRWFTASLKLAANATSFCSTRTAKAASAQRLFSVSWFLCSNVVVL
jgi:hypothetical protein